MEQSVYCAENHTAKQTTNQKNRPFDFRPGAGKDVHRVQVAHDRTEGHHKNSEKALQHHIRSAQDEKGV